MTELDVDLRPPSLRQVFEINGRKGGKLNPVCEVHLKVGASSFIDQGVVDQ